jgi:hypothetical protein
MSQKSIATPNAALTATDRCDRCGAAASVVVIVPSGGELLFCNHHGREHQLRLDELAAVILDPNDSLQFKPEKY